MIDCITNVQNGLLIYNQLNDQYFYNLLTKVYLPLAPRTNLENEKMSLKHSKEKCYLLIMRSK